MVLLTLRGRVNLKSAKIKRAEPAAADATVIMAAGIILVAADRTTTINKTSFDCPKL
jgi:hypothetical protein